MTDAAITYMPKYRAFVAGEHTSVPCDWGRLETFSLRADPIGAVICDARCRDRGRMELVRAYCALLVVQQKLSPLDSVFTGLDLDGTVHDEEFRTNVSEPQTVPHLGRYEPNDKYGTLRFDLRNAPNSYDVPTGFAKDAPYDEAYADVLSALRRREQSAAAALKHIPYHYHKNTSGNPEFFRTEIPDDAQRICYPDGNISNPKTLDEICRFVGRFAKGSKLPPTHAACSPYTATLMGLNTETGADPRFEARGGEFPFPGLPSHDPWTPKMAVSPACPDDVLYVTSKMSRVLLRAEGPKITRREPGALAVTDFFQYKCAYQDLQTDSPFACIIDLHAA